MAPAPSTSGPSRARTAKPATKRTPAKRTATAKRATKPATPPAPRTPADVVGEYAERAVLIPVGAALIARERVVSSVNEAITTYTTPTKAQTQLKRFERRGTSARKGLERDLRKTRTRVERELRQRRRGFEKTVTRLERRRDAAAKSVTEQVEHASSQFENVFGSRLKSGTELATRLQDRVLSRV